MKTFPILTATRGGRLALAAALGMGTISFVLLSGCTNWSEYVHNGYKVGPNYTPPCAPVSAQWIDADATRVLSAPPDRDTWWAVFNDPVLGELMLTAYRQNPNLKVACWRIQEFRALRAIAYGELFPQTQSAYGAVQREHATQTLLETDRSPFYNDFSLGVGLSWELDFWGKYRRTVEAADAAWCASVDAYNNALVLLLADVASTYLEIRTVDLRLAYTRRNVQVQKGSLEIAVQRFRNGTTSELDVSQAKSYLEETESLIPKLETQRRQAANGLCILLGMPPKDITGLLRGEQPIPPTPSQVAVGIPADLLRHRPDVLEAERLVAAESARIGIATSELYPHFYINGALGVETAEFPEMFESRSLEAAVGPAFSWNILNYGRVVNGIRVHDARFEQRAYAYQATVLRAYDEAEDALVGFLKAQERLKELVQSADDGKRSVDLAVQQYRQGIADYNRVYTMERLLTEVQDRMASAQGDVPLNLVLLYKALGGGWETPPHAPTLASPPEAIQPDSPPGAIRLPSPPGAVPPASPPGATIPVWPEPVEPPFAQPTRPI